MLKRVATGLVGIGIFLGLCFAGPLPFAIGTAAVAGIAAWEYRNACATHRDGGSGNPVQGLLLGASVLLPILLYLLPVRTLERGTVVALLMAGAVGVFSLLTGSASRGGRAVHETLRGYGLLGAIWIGGLFSGLVLLRSIPSRLLVVPFGMADRGAWLALYVAVCVWAADTFALFVGRSLGRHALAPELSPRKTVEGAAGGFVGAALIGALAGWRLGLPWYHGLAMGAIAGLVSPVGDLFESAVKRDLAVKDLGNAMPGHGGVLDRFDSLLFVMPLAYLYARLIVGW